MVRDVGVLSLSQMVLNMGFSQMVPVIPLFVAQVGNDMGSLGVGLVMAAPSAAMMVLNVPLGRLCDTTGRKPLMYLGTALTAVGTLMSGFAGSVLTLAACRLLVGAGICASSTGSSAYMADLTDRAPGHRAKIMGINQAIAGSVWVVGPAAGGYLADAYGYRNSFVIASVGAALCSVGYSRLPETLVRARVGSASQSAPGGTSGDRPSIGSAADETRGRWASARLSAAQWREDIMPLLRCGNQQALVALSAVPSLRWSCFSTVVTLHAASVLGGGPKEVGLMFTALALSQGLSMPVGAYLADKVGGARLPIVVPAGLLSCAAFASVGVATSLDQFLAAMAVQGFCAGFTLPAQGAFRAESTPQALRGQAMSLERQAGSVISLVGPIGLGLLADLAGSQTSIFLTASLMAGCHLVYILRAKPGPGLWF